MADRGRPRAFDRDTALLHAMRLFWERGYEAASLSSLTAAMDINGPSLYATFGSKEALFRAAVERYVAAESKETQAVLAAAATAKEAIEALLRRAARRNVRKGDPKGCLVMISAIHGAPENRHISEYLVSLRHSAERAIQERIARGVAEGDVNPGADIDDLASFYVAVLKGLSLSARDGASKHELDSVVTRAMSAWDASPRSNE